jgi:hypothetical protein
MAMAEAMDPVVLREKLENIWDGMDRHYISTGKMAPAAKGTPLPGLHEPVRLASHPSASPHTAILLILPAHSGCSLGTRGATPRDMP